MISDRHIFGGLLLHVMCGHHDLQFRVYLRYETAGPSRSQLRGLKKFL
jgi:hypothetical protein